MANLMANYPRFNEAATDRSRKDSPLGGKGGPPKPGFNEAATDRSRKGASSMLPSFVGSFRLQ